MNKFIFTSESVTKGRPDKVSDIISDSILDAYLATDFTWEKTDIAEDLKKKVQEVAE